MKIKVTFRSHERYCMRFLLSSLVLLLAAGLPALAQNGNATITGIVTDVSGAVVAGAKVSITNTATGVAHSAVSDNAGVYFFQDLIPGPYVLDVTANGMRHFQATGIQLSVDQRARLDAKLEVGPATSQEVRVSADSVALLQATDASVGTVIDSQQVVQLPLNGRFITQLLELSPGAVPSSYSNNFSNPGNPLSTGDQRNGQPSFDVNGQNGGQTYFRLDGMENNERSFGGSNIAISVDAVQEFKLQTSNFSAEYGRSPTQVDVVTKSGTNSFHGVLFEFLRNDALDAAQWVYGGPNQKNDLKRNQFGGALGGPIKKNKLFFFGDVDVTRQVYADPLVETVPTDAMRQGVFPSGEVIFNPATQQPFPNNTVTQNYWSSISTSILPYIPQANRPGTPLTSAAGLPLAPANNYLYIPRKTQNTNQYNGRVDFNQSDKNNYFVRYTYETNQIIGDGPLATNLNGSIIGSEIANLGGSNLTGGWFHTFSSNKINQASGGYSTDPQNYRKGDTTNYAAKFGMTGLLYPDAYPGFPHIQIGSLNMGSGDNRPLQASQTFFGGADVFTLVAGRHTVRAGGEVRRALLLTTNSNESTGIFTFNGVQTRDRNFGASGTTYCPGNPDPTSCQAGDPMADFLLGNLSSASRGTVILPTHKYYTNYAVFVNDSFRAIPTLTLDVGLRYEYETRNHASPPFYTQPLFANGQPFAGGTGLGFTGMIAVANDSSGQISSRVIPGAPELIPGSVETCREAGLPDNCAISQKNGWQPRVGFAWTPSPTSVLRGGFGIFFGSYPGDSDEESCEGYPLELTEGTQTYTLPPSGNAPPPLQFANAFNGTTPAAPSYGQCAMPLRRLPQTYQWNLTVQQGLGAKTSLSIGYIGSLTHHLDQAVVGTQSAYNIPVPWGVVLGPNQSQSIPFPAFSTVAPYLTVDNANYNALQAVLQRQISHGLQFDAAYTFAKNLGTQSWLSDPRNYKFDYGPLPNDLRNVVTINAIYSLPFGKDQHWSPTNVVARTLASGWTASSIFNWHTGFGFNPVLSGTDLLLLNGNHVEDRPDAVCSGNPSNRTPNNWYDASCFVYPTEPTTVGASLREGNEGVGILRGPHTTTQDFGLAKMTNIRENTTLEIRVEAFNLWNHTVLGLPNYFQSPFAPPFTGITYVDETPRQIQLAAKLSF
jgi:hypothetical protein